MGLMDVRDVGEDEVNHQQSTELLIDDDVFVDSDYESTCSSVRSAAVSTSSDDDDDETSTTKSTTVIRCCDDGAELCRVRLGRPLGAGGFGRVYEAQLLQQGADGWRRDRRVAVKIPRSGEASTTDSFLAESALVSLRHANVVSVLAVGWTCAGDDRCSRRADVIPAIVMECAGRRSLQSVIDNSPQTLSLRRRLK